jgi:hypothetical protein
LRANASLELELKCEGITLVGSSRPAAAGSVSLGLARTEVRIGFAIVKQPFGDPSSFVWRLPDFGGTGTGLSLLKQRSAKVPTAEGCAGARAVELKFSSVLEPRFECPTDSPTVVGDPSSFAEASADGNGIIPAKAGLHESGLRHRRCAIAHGGRTEVRIGFAIACGDPNGFEPVLMHASNCAKTELNRVEQAYKRH